MSQRKMSTMDTLLADPNVERKSTHTLLRSLVGTLTIAQESKIAWMSETVASRCMQGRILGKYLEEIDTKSQAFCGSIWRK